MNNKGFAISTMMYMILILGLTIVAIVIAMFNTRGNILNKLKSDVQNEINDTEGNLIVSELVIQTMDSFIEGEDDTLTVVYSVSDTEDSSVGFSIQDKLYDETPVNLVYNRLNTIHVDGKLERNAEYNKTYTSVPVNKYPEGSIFEIKTVVIL